MRTSEPLRIGIVAPVWLTIPPPAYGGVEWIVHWLVEGMTARGHEVTLAATGGSESPAARCISPYETPPVGRIGESLPELVHAIAAYDSLGHQDVIHDHTLAGPVIATAGGTPAVHTVHGPLDHDTVRLLERLRGVELVAISNRQRVMGRQLPWCATVHNAIDVHSFPFRADKDGYLCTMARMCPAKGIVEAIELARRLGMPLRIAAKCHEPAEAEFFASQVAPRLGGDIEYVGELNTAEKKELLAGASALAFPIQWEEPFGLAIIEALACGTPVLATPRGSVPELVRHGVTGLVGTDVAALAREAEESMHAIDPAACRADAERRFDVTRLVDEYEQVYYASAGRSGLRFGNSAAG